MGYSTIDETGNEDEKTRTERESNSIVLVEVLYHRPEKGNISKRRKRSRRRRRKREKGWFNDQRVQRSFHLPMILSFKEERGIKMSSQVQIGPDGGGSQEVNQAQLGLL